MELAGFEQKTMEMALGLWSNGFDIYPTAPLHPITKRHWCMEARCTKKFEPHRCENFLGFALAGIQGTMSVG